MIVPRVGEDGNLDRGGRLAGGERERAGCRHKVETGRRIDRDGLVIDRDGSQASHRFGPPEHGDPGRFGNGDSGRAELKDAGRIPGPSPSRWPYRLRDRAGIAAAVAVAICVINPGAVAVTVRVTVASTRDSASPSGRQPGPRPVALFPGWTWTSRKRGRSKAASSKTTLVAGFGPVLRTVAVKIKSCPVNTVGYWGTRLTAKLADGKTVADIEGLIVRGIGVELAAGGRGGQSAWSRSPSGITMIVTVADDPAPIAPRVGREHTRLIGQALVLGWMSPRRAERRGARGSTRSRPWHPTDPRSRP